MPGRLVLPLGTAARHESGKLRVDFAEQRALSEEPGMEMTDDTKIIWNEFWKLGEARTNVPGIRARVVLTRPRLPGCRQFSVGTGSGHNFLVDDPASGAGPKPIELVAAALAGCAASDVIAILRDSKHQFVTGYEVQVE